MLIRSVLLLTAILFAPAAEACTSAATYRSVVLNSAPDHVLEGATVFHVQIESAYLADREIQGIRGTLLEAAGTLPAGAEIEVSTRLASMCDTWVEIWSDNPSVTDGVLSGYVVGRIVGEMNGRTVVWPAMYRGENYREGNGGYGIWLATRDGRDVQRPGGRWGPMRVDGEALANNLNETNRMIREALEDSGND